MNKEHFDQWLHELRTTTSGQGQSQLMWTQAGERYYCCLGLGCEVMGLEPHVELDSEFPSYGARRAQLLAPVEFIVWLGLDPNSPSFRDHERSQGEFDVRVDYPEALCMQDDSNPPSAAGMNDSGFTFSQIADVFEYFGIKEA